MYYRLLVPNSQASRAYKDISAADLGALEKNGEFFTRLKGEHGNAQFENEGSLCAIVRAVRVGRRKHENYSSRSTCLTGLENEIKRGNLARRRISDLEQQIALEQRIGGVTRLSREVKLSR